MTAGAVGEQHQLVPPLAQRQEERQQQNQDQQPMADRHVNRDRAVCVFGSRDGEYWHRALSWRKDTWPMRFFQYGNAFLPDGNNNSGLLAVSTIAVANGDLVTGLWRVNSAGML